MWTQPNNIRKQQHNNIRTQGASGIVLKEQEREYRRLLQHRAIRGEQITYIKLSTEIKTTSLLSGNFAKFGCDQG